MAVFDIKTWLASLKTEFNIPDDKIPTKEIEGYGLRLDDYHRQSQVVKDKEAELNTKFAALEPFEKFLRTLETDYQWGPREQWSAEQVSFAKQNQTDATRQPAGMDKTAVQELVSAAVKTALDEQNQHFSRQLENTQRGAALLIDFIPEARDEWRETYGGKYGIPAKFPKPEFEQFISPGDPEHGVPAGAGYGVPLQTAWTLFKQPYQTKLNEATWEAKVKEAEDAGYRRGASQGPGSLEPYGGDLAMSAGALADRQNQIPESERKAGPSEAESRSRFTERFRATVASGGVVPSTVIAPATASK